ncbi:MAG: LysR family transcriptional regulator [Pseudodesulfovibrio sp.]|uniref:Regulatory protein LysR n=1 Tax=Pseudodesulfovibrio aespoeensis (strain ATCC 700646 / DSM 10631 / Aspo-2) TaxID=643562 RepID=E6VV94_PSEA9|nr:MULTISPECIES: LysR family transcriptional regulator [Pseudodesulfovibrio]MBU4243740.1 LysR family transcriptional regulator [Pseudomonadota bacterium]ADU62338.1 regulatory protein LysR [Pseudodesulfovibrio aespoeensis Aspo-2]MBU4377673.1 LysR family transcriptional regulator [Pseudomonadota bacterium]MBU4473997.1 LysR family transcriptional regulator [Pseudomonadota bacterium]MBU4515195.1 LysR family transcriptional regulator [Pseudomonadota bacterium]
MPKKNTTTIRLRVWIEQDNETYLGIGSTLLLQHIERLGSLRKAAEELGMSYRRAWGKLKNAEERIGHPLVEKVRGQGQRFTLSPYGRDLMDRFLHFYLDVEDYAARRASEVLGMKVDKAGEFYREDTE